MIQTFTFQKIDVFIVVGGQNKDSGTMYNEDDIIMVDRDSLASAAAFDAEDLEKVKNAAGEFVYQCTVCPMSFKVWINLNAIIIN